MTGRVPRQGPILIALALAGFVTALDNNVVNVALPTVQRDLRASIPALEWIVSGYVLSFASLLLVGGRLADLWGRRRVLLVGLLALVVTSTSAGFATTAPILVVARVAQGAAAALVMPASLAVLATDVHRDRRELASGIWTAALAVALALGPVVGGVLTEHVHWSWIFFLHLPVGILTIALVRWGLPKTDPPLWTGSPRDLDLSGLGLATLLLAAASFAMVEGQSIGFTHPAILFATVVAAGCLPVLIRAERRASAPTVEFNLLSNRVFAGGTLAQVLWGLGVNGTFLYTSLYLQDVLRFSPAAAGLIFVPLAGVLVLCVPLTPALTARFSAQWTVTAGMVLVGLGLGLLSLAGEDSGVLELLPGLMAIGVGSALITPLTAAVLSSVPERSAGVASAMVGAGREASGVLGVAVIGVVVSSTSQAAFPTGYVTGYTAGLRVAALLLLLGAIITAVALKPVNRPEATVTPLHRERQGRL